MFNKWTCFVPRNSKYNQHANLEYTDQQTESKYQADSHRMLRNPNRSSFAFSMIMILYAWLSKREYWVTTVCIAAAAAVCLVFPKSTCWRRLAIHPALLILELELISEGSVCEQIGLLLPSFILSI